MNLIHHYNKKETRRSSLTLKWVAIVATTIMVSFVIFSLTIYSLIKSQSLEQESDVTKNVVRTFEQRLVNINEPFQVSNVVTTLSSNTLRLISGNSPNYNRKDNGVFDDDILATLTNKDINIYIFDPQKNLVFSNSNWVSNEDLKSVNQKKASELIYKTRGGMHFRNAERIYSNDNRKLLGTLVVDNRMVQTNKLLKQLQQSMVFLSILAIIFFLVASYFIVDGIVKPIKRMTKISREIDQDPNARERMPNIRRNDELGELVVNFNKMLDRIQNYILQQKQFVGDVSHELRTPVAVIQGHLNLLERWGKDDPQILEESIHASLQETDRMKHLIQEMLDLTRAEQVDIQFPDKVSDVNEVLIRTVNDMKMIHKDFTINLDIADLKPDTIIKMYRNHLEQLLIILIDNAIKYSTDRKEVNVSASTENKSVIIAVQDFGEGIDSVEQEKIFNRFYRVDKARTREKGGNGLGLSIAKKLTESYHGTIGVTSILGTGSTFRLKFPLLKKKSLTGSQATK